MVDCRAHTIYGLLGPGSSIRIDVVHHPDAFVPESIQDSTVADGRVGAHRVDAGLNHELSVALHVACEVQAIWVPGASRHRVPGHALEVQRLAVHKQLTAGNLNPWAARWRRRGPRQRLRCGHRRRLWRRTHGSRIRQAAGAEHVRGVANLLVAGVLALDVAALVALLLRSYAHVAEALAVVVTAATVGGSEHQGPAVATSDVSVHARPLAEGGAAGWLGRRGSRRLDGLGGRCGGQASTRARRVRQPASAEHVGGARDRLVAGMLTFDITTLGTLFCCGDALVPEAGTVAVASAAVGPGEHQGTAGTTSDTVVHAGPLPKGMAATRVGMVLVLLLPQAEHLRRDRFALYQLSCLQIGGTLGERHRWCRTVRACLRRIC
mmetsp:Transcript_7917/g.18212  ORF Transcript_7917/g.18212 Transcript_7917/m.18212 type:complete len:379 (-) Transcript_7917:143-1279(-)